MPTSAPAPAPPIQPPRGLKRSILRAPTWLYRLHLGWLLGTRFLLLEHVGRKSGRLRRAVLEVVKHDREVNVYYVGSGWGPKADWYLNVHHNPEVQIQLGQRRLRALASEVPETVAIAIYGEYGQRHPTAFKLLTWQFLGAALEPGPAAAARLFQRMPMIALRPW